MQRAQSVSGVVSGRDLPESLRHAGGLFRKVRVTPEDSVVGVAVRNGCSVSDLRRFNRGLIFDYCDHHEFLWVPVDPARAHELVAAPSQETRAINKKHMLTREFILRCGTGSEMEAEFYLSEHNDDVAKAVKHYKDDLAWEELQNQAARPAAIAAPPSRSSTRAPKSPPSSSAVEMRRPLMAPDDYYR